MYTKDAILIGLAVVLPVLPLAWTAATTPQLPEEAELVEPRGPGLGPPPPQGVERARAEPDHGDLLHADGLTLGHLIRNLAIQAEELETDPDVRLHWQQLVASHQLADTEAAFTEFSKVRLVHEAFRAGGWAGTRWAVTDAEPDSKRIWKVWLHNAEVEVEAECDELSALFAFVAHQTGVEHVGLFWPTWNHTVAVWTTPGRDGSPVRVVVPTSQVYLDPVAGLGDRTFDPGTQGTIYDYTAKDVLPGQLLPEVVARRILEGARRHGGDSSEELILRRLRGGWFRR